ncbi:uncharacterized protein LOC116033223 [Ipomoea triloba]|uniref:uncharacterized protein LOC116033223 n=1 Tax=Ipomoea triloba TaxID=35885 RepID=UPI00125D51C5|nr:uncharacterized protein LOC116033223 [Ipomoea triloba]
MAAHGLVCSGVRRRIGNGANTLAWGDPWLLDTNSPVVNTIMPPHLSGPVVQGLIDPVTGSWDLPLLCDIFDQSNVDRIVGIPISPTFEDSWYWFGDPKGCYSVKHGYRVLVGECTVLPPGFHSWAKHRKLKVPPKWKNFLWRAIRNILPTTTNLLNRRVDVSPACPMCGEFNEDVLHALSLWTSLDATQLDLFVAVLHSIWLARNRAVWEAAMPAPRAVWRAAARACTDWRSATALHTPASPTPMQIPVVPLPQASLSSSVQLCYVDGGFNAHTSEAVFGAILLSSSGSFVAAVNGPLNHCLNPMMAESMAFREALAWLRGKNIGSVCFFSDCINLVNNISAPMIHDRSYAGIILAQCRRLLNLFTVCSLHYVPRSSNFFAHSLATAAYSQANTLFWDSVPPFISINI